MAKAKTIKALPVKGFGQLRTILENGIEGVIEAGRQVAKQVGGEKGRAMSDLNKVLINKRSEIIAGRDLDDNAPVEHHVFQLFDVYGTMSTLDVINYLIDMHDVSDVTDAVQRLATLGILGVTKSHPSQMHAIYDILKGKTVNDLYKAIPKPAIIKQPETFIHSDNSVINIDEGLDRCIWKFMQDNKHRLIQDIGSGLGEFGFRPVDVKDRVIVLLRKKWFDRTGSGKSTTYALKKHVTIPELPAAAVEAQTANFKVPSTLKVAMESFPSMTVTPLGEIIAQGSVGDCGVVLIRQGDCGTTGSLEWLIRNQDDLKKLDGKNYTDFNGIVRRITTQDKRLIGQMIQLRSIVQCNLDTDNEVCEVCFGDISKASELVTPHVQDGDTVKLLNIIDKHIAARRAAKETAMSKKQAEKKEETKPAVAQVEPKAGEGINTAIWKVVSDYNPWTSAEVELVLGELGYKASSVNSRISDLYLNKGWFDKAEVKEGRTFAYVLRKGIEMPLNETPYTPRARVSKALASPKKVEAIKEKLAASSAGVLAELTNSNAVPANTTGLSSQPDRSESEDVGRLSPVADSSEVRAHVREQAEKAFEEVIAPIALVSFVVKIGGIDFSEAEAEAIAGQLKQAGFGSGKEPEQAGQLVQFDIGVSIKGVRYPTELANKVAEALFAKGFAKDVTVED